MIFCYVVLLICSMFFTQISRGQAPTEAPRLSLTAPTCLHCSQRGTIEYRGENHCQCKCTPQAGTTETGENGTIYYLPPDCRYSVSQSVTVYVEIDVVPASFVFTSFVASIIPNLNSYSSMTGEFRLITVKNLTTKLGVKFDIRDDGPLRGGNQPAAFHFQTMKQAVTDAAQWTVDLRVLSIKEVPLVDGAEFEIMMLGTVEGYSIPVEAFLVLIGFCMISFILFASEIILSENFVADEDAEREELRRWKKEKRKRKLADYVFKGATPAAAVDVAPADPVADTPDEPKDAWLSDNDQGYIAPVEEKKERKGLRSLKDFAAKFYKQT